MEFGDFSAQGSISRLRIFDHQRLYGGHRLLLLLLLLLRPLDVDRLWVFFG
jgi:hypothetical protein